MEKVDTIYLLRLLHRIEEKMQCHNQLDIGDITSFHTSSALLEKIRAQTT